MTDQAPEQQDLSTGAGDVPLVQFRYEWCKKCGICVAFCPRKALAIGAKGLPELANPAACTQCRLCEFLCPDFVITVAPRKPKTASAPAGETE